MANSDPDKVINLNNQLDDLFWKGSHLECLQHVATQGMFLLDLSTAEVKANAAWKMGNILCILLWTQVNGIPKCMLMWSMVA